MGAVAGLLGGAAGAGIILQLRCRDGGMALDHLLRAAARPAYTCGWSAPELQDRASPAGGLDSRQICPSKRRRWGQRRGVAESGCGQAGAFFLPHST